MKNTCFENIAWGLKGWELGPCCHIPLINGLERKNNKKESTGWGCSSFAVCLACWQGLPPSRGLNTSQSSQGPHPVRYCGTLFHDPFHLPLSSSSFVQCKDGENGKVLRVKAIRRFLTFPEILRTSKKDLWLSLKDSVHNLGVHFFFDSFHASFVSTSRPCWTESPCLTECPHLQAEGRGRVMFV